MMQAPAPRHFVPRTMSADGGMPHDRVSRLAARRAFVELKQSFVDAVAGLDGARSDWLRHQVRCTEEPIDLWLLRAMVFDELDEADEADEGAVSHRQRLRRCLASIFPDSEPAIGFAPLQPAAPAVLQRPR